MRAALATPMANPRSADFLPACRGSLVPGLCLLSRDPVSGDLTPISSNCLRTRAAASSNSPLSTLVELFIARSLQPLVDVVSAKLEVGREQAKICRAFPL